MGSVLFSNVVRAAVVMCLGALPAFAQRERGELRLDVTDESGAALMASAELVSQSNQFVRRFQTAADGHYTAQELPFGVYRLSLSHEGFTATTQLVELRSEVPVHLAIVMGIAPVMSQVLVHDSATLVNPYQTGTVRSIGNLAVSEQMSPQPGRDILDLVDSQPGWWYEANGVLHPRGSEYDVQFVVDGLPLTQNRSPAFAPAFESSDVESMRVLTAGYPAEYGRKLGGVVEVVSSKDSVPGLHGQVEAEGGSFDTGALDAAVAYASGANRFAVSGGGFHTDRYLDPPVLANYSNLSNATSISGTYERDLSQRDRVRFTFTDDTVRFMAPNNLTQQQAGQRQDLSNTETGGQVSYQHIISPNLLLSAQGSVREATATLYSSPTSTPIVVFQDRGYREGYARVDIAGHKGRHDWKAGIDTLFSPVYENLQYQITDPSQFDPGTQQSLNFSGHRWDVEPSVYVQDQVRLGNWNLGFGLRYDYYRFVVSQSAVSPRVSVSHYSPSIGLMLHAAYDRVFQTPAMENLLLASSPELDSVASTVLRVPVPPAHANYYEVGATKAFMNVLRVDVNVFRRAFTNLSDDDTLFDTGVSFPISFATGLITGEEVRVDVPKWGRFSGFASYTNQTASGWGPITGGLFLGQESADGTVDTSKFPVGSDQRNTFRTRVRFQASQRCWLSLGTAYGSGMPVELDADSIDYESLLQQYGQAILDQVNFERGRVRPNFSLDAALGVAVYQRERMGVYFQVQGTNLTNHVNVINFASLLSGTAVGAPRSVGARLKFAF